VPNLFIVNVPEFEAIIEVALRDPNVTRRELGSYVELSSPTQIALDRRATGVRHAIWYSAIGGISDGKIVQHDKDQLKVVPSGEVDISL
jgi:hypothetical protein